MGIPGGIMPGRGGTPIVGMPGGIMPGRGGMPIGGMPIGMEARLPVTGALAITIRNELHFTGTLASHERSARTAQTTHGTSKSLRSGVQRSGGHASSSDAAHTRAGGSHLRRELRVKERRETHILWRRSLNLKGDNVLATEQHQSECVLLLTLFDRAYDSQRERAKTVGIDGRGLRFDSAELFAVAQNQVHVFVKGHKRTDQRATIN